MALSVVRKRLEYVLKVFGFINVYRLRTVREYRVGKCDCIMSNNYLIELFTKSVQSGRLLLVAKHL